MSWQSMALGGLAVAGMGVLLSCGAHSVHVSVSQVMCLPTTVTPGQLVGDVVASHAIRPGVSSVRVRTLQGDIITYWGRGDTLIGIDLAPDNEQTPIWLREPGEGCVWRYGKGREI